MVEAREAGDGNFPDQTLPRNDDDGGGDVKDELDYTAGDVLHLLKGDGKEETRNLDDELYSVLPSNAPTAKKGDYNTMYPNPVDDADVYDAQDGNVPVKPKSRPCAVQ